MGVHLTRIELANDNDCFVMRTYAVVESEHLLDEPTGVSFSHKLVTTMHFILVSYC